MRKVESVAFRQLLRYLLYLLTLAICVVFLSCSRKDNRINHRPCPDDLSMVYICTGESATCYHSTDACLGLKSCKGEINHMELEVAKGFRKPCPICYNVESDLNLPKYVYRDNNGTIHYDEKCLHLRHGRDQGINNKTYIELADYKMSVNEKFCTYCISDSIYEILKTISDGNQSVQFYCDTVAIE